MKIAPFMLMKLLNTCLFRSGSVLVRISLAPYKYVPICMCIVKDTYYIRIHVYA